MKTLKNYLPFDLNQIHQIGATCYIMGTFLGTRNGVSVLDHASVSYEDVRGRVHAAIFNHVCCKVTLVNLAAPGAMVRIVAEPSGVTEQGDVLYSGVIFDTADPVYTDDPAYSINRARIPNRHGI